MYLFEGERERENFSPAVLLPKCLQQLGLEAEARSLKLHRGSRTWVVGAQGLEPSLVASKGVH